MDVFDVGSVVGAIELEDHLTPAIKRASEELVKAGRYVNEYGALVRRAGEESERAGDRILRGAEDASRFGGAMTTAFKATIGAAAAVVGAVTSIGGAILGLATKGSSLVGIEDSFKNIAESAGIAGDVLIDHLDAALKSTVDQTEQMQALTQALSAGVRLTAKDMDVLGAAARAVGKATGTDAAHGLDTLTTALTRGNDRILRRIGITIDSQKAEEKFAESIGTTADRLTQAGKLEAKRIAMLQSMADYVRKSGEAELSLSERLTQLRLAISNWFDDIAKAVARSPVLKEAFDRVGESIKRTFGPELLKGSVDLIMKGVDGFGRAVIQVMPYVDAVVDRVKGFWNWLVQLNDRFKITETVSRVAQGAMRFLGQAVEYTREAVTTLMKAWQSMPDWLQTIARTAALTGVGFYAVGKAVDAAREPFMDLVRTVDTWINIATNVTSTSHMLYDNFERLANSQTVLGTTFRGLLTVLGMFVHPVRTLQAIFPVLATGITDTAAAQTELARQWGLGAVSASESAVAAERYAASLAHVTEAEIAAAAARGRHQAAIELDQIGLFDVGQRGPAPVGVVNPSDLGDAGKKAARSGTLRAFEEGSLRMTMVEEQAEAAALASTRAATAAEAASKAELVTVSSGTVLLGQLTLVGGAIALVTYGIKELTGSWTAAFTVMLPPVGMAMMAWQNLTAQWAIARKEIDPLLDVLGDLGSLMSSAVTLSAAAARDAWSALVGQVDKVRAAFVNAARDVQDGLSGIAERSRLAAAMIGASEPDFGWAEKLPMTMRDAQLAVLTAVTAMIPGFGQLAPYVGAVAGNFKLLAASVKAAAAEQREQAKQALIAAGQFQGKADVNPAITDITPFSAQIDDLQKRLNALSADKLKEIAAGLRIPGNTAEMVAQRLGVATDLVQAYAAGLADVARENTVVDKTIGELTARWDKMTPAARASKDTVQEFGRIAANMRKNGADLPPWLNDLADKFENLAFQVNNVKGLVEELSGKGATASLMDLTGAWRALPQALKANLPVQDEVLKRYLSFAPQIRTVTGATASAVKEMNALAMSRGAFNMPFETGIRSMEGIGTVVQGILIPGLKGTAAEIEVVDKAFAELLQREADAARSRTGAIEAVGVVQSMPASAVNVEAIDKNIALVLQRDKTMNDTLRQSASSTAAFQIIQAKEAGDQQRAQMDRTSEAFRASTDLELMAITQIIRQQDDWETSLQEVTQQLKALGVDIPDDKIRELAEAMDEAARRAPKVVSGLQRLNAVGQVLDRLGQGFVNMSQVADGAMADIVRFIGQVVVAADNAIASVSGIFTAIGKMGKGVKGAGLELGMSLVGGIMEGITGIIQGGSNSSIGKAIVQGGLGGAQMGSAIGVGLAAAIGTSTMQGLATAGIWGAAAGFIVGAIVAVWKGSETRRIMHQVGRQWGGDISEGLAEAIKKTSKEMFDGSKDAAQVFLLQQTIAEKGIQTARTWGTAIHKLRDTFSMLETGQFSAAQATKVLDENFKTFVDTLGGNVNPQLREIIRLNEAAGTKSKAIAEYVDAQAKTALNAFGGFVMMRGEVASALAEAEKRLDDATKHGRKSDIKEATEDVAKLRKQLDGLPLTGGGANAIGASFLGVFDRLTKDGAPALDVLREMSPVIDSAAKQFQDAGLSGGDAFAKIQSMAQLATDQIAGPGLTAVAQWGAGLQALENSDILTPQLYSDIAGQITAQVEALKAQGKTAEEIYPFIGGSLQTMWEQQHDYNYQVDEATQKILDEAEAAGVVGDKHRSVQEQMLLGIDRMVDAVEGLAEVFGVHLPKKMQEAADQGKLRAGDIERYFDKVRPDINVRYNIPELKLPTPPPVHVPVKYEQGEMPAPPPYKPNGGEYPDRADGYSGGGLVRQHPATVLYPQAYATGGVVTPAAESPVYAATGKVIPFTPRGTDTVPAMLTPREYVLPVSVTARVGVPALEALRKGEAAVVPTKNRAAGLAAAASLVLTLAGMPSAAQAASSGVRGQVAYAATGGLIEGGAAGTGTSTVTLPGSQPPASLVSQLREQQKAIEHLISQQVVEQAQVQRSIVEQVFRREAVNAQASTEVSAVRTVIQKLFADKVRESVSLVAQAINRVFEQAAPSVVIGSAGGLLPGELTQRGPGGTVVVPTPGGPLPGARGGRQINAAGGLLPNEQTVPGPKAPLGNSPEASLPGEIRIPLGIDTGPITDAERVIDELREQETKKWKTFTDEFGQVWTVVGGMVGTIKGDLNKGWGDLIGRIDNSADRIEAFDTQVRTAAAATADVAEPAAIATREFERWQAAVQAVPKQVGVTVNTDAASLDTAAKTVSDIPAEKTLDIVAQSAGLPQITSDIKAIPDQKQFELAARSAGLPQITSDIKAIPDRKALDVLARSIGVKEVVTDIGSIPAKKDVLAAVAATGIEATLGAINTIPTSRDTVVAVGQTGVDDVLDALGTIPDAQAVDIQLPTRARMSASAGAVVDAIMAQLDRLPRQIVIDIAPGGGGGSSPAPAPQPGPITRLPSPTPYPDPNSPLPSPTPYPSPKFPLPSPTPYPGPVIGSPGSGGSFLLATGGIVTQSMADAYVSYTDTRVATSYLDVGGFPGGPRGTDVVPAWLTPREMVLTERQQRHLLQLVQSGPAATPSVPEQASTTARFEERLVTPPAGDGPVIINHNPTYRAASLDPDTAVKMLSDPAWQQRLADASLSGMAQGGKRIKVLQQLARKPTV